MIENSSSVKTFTEISVALPPSSVELICDFIIDNFTNGIVLEDEEDSKFTLIKFYIPEDKEGITINQLNCVNNGGNENETNV